MRVLFAIVILMTVFGCLQKQSKRYEEAAVVVNKYLINNVDSLVDLSALLLEAIDNRRYNDIHEIFYRMRQHYKRVEPITEYHFPGVSKSLNGPALDKIEEGDDKLIEATGFQVIEELIFPDINMEDFEELRIQAKILDAILARLKQLVGSNQYTDASIFEAIRLEVLRVMSLGISGFDSPVALNSIPESLAAMEGISFMLESYKNELPKESLHVYDTLITRLQSMKTYLIRHTDFSAFDRAEFFTIHCNPVTSSIYAYQQALGIENNKWLTAVRMDKPIFFDEDVFDVRFFSPTYNRERNKNLEDLGRLLFFDPILSGNNSRSCASCHKPSQAFSDGETKSKAFNFNGKVARNAPSVINSAFQQSQFWDGRVSYLEDQVTDVLTNPTEMHGDIDRAAATLGQSEEYVALFTNCFNTSKEKAMSNLNIQMALAAYIRSLKSFNAPFDQYMRGDKSKMSKEQINGFNLFMGKAKCGTCHFLPLFNGTVPPFYKETESEVLGTPVKAVTVSGNVGSDRGKYQVYQHPLLDRMFKTPTVRNASLTAPYMHNGVYQSLEEVIDFYNRGGGAGIGIELDNQTLPADPLNLTETEQKDLVAFIHALTDTTYVSDVPQKLPEFSDTKLNKRKIGGEY